MSLNFIKAWRNDKYNKIVLMWRFTLVLIKINYGQIGDQTGLFHTTNPIFYTSGNRCVRHTGTFGNLWFFHLSRRTTVIQDLLVRRQFSLVPDNRTNVNVEAWEDLPVSEEKIFRNRPIRNKNCLWQPCLLMNRSKMSNLYRGPSIDASYQVSVHMAVGFQRRRLKCEKLTDNRRQTPTWRRQVMAKPHIAFGKVS